MSIVKNLNINLSVITKGLQAAFKKASKTVSSFAKDIKAIGGSAAKALGVGMAAAGGAIAGIAISSGLAIDRLGELLAVNGATAEGFTRLARAADIGGVGVEQLSGMMKKMNDNLANSPDSPVGKTLAGMGLDIANLQAMKPEDAVKAIGAEIAKLPTVAQRTSAAMAIFGKSGADALDFLTMAPDKMEALAKEADALGLTLNQAQVDVVGESFDAIGKVTGAVEGLGNMVAVKLAPYITMASEALVGFITQAGGMDTIVNKAFEGVIWAVGMVADVIHTAKLGFMIMQSAMTKGLSLIVNAVSYLVKAFDTVAQALGWDTKFSETTDAIAADLDKLAKDQYAKFEQELIKPPPSEGIKKFFEETEKKAAETAAKINAANASVEGPDMAALIKQQQEQDALAKKAAEASKALADKVKSVTEANETPLEKYKRELAELEELYRNAQLDPNVEFSSETFDRAKAALDKELGESQKGKGGNERIANAATTANSTDIISVLTRKRSGDPAKQQLDIAKSSNTELKNIKQGINDMAKAMQENQFQIAGF